MLSNAKILLQRVLNRFGYQIRRLDSGVSLADAFQEQIRLLGGKANVVFEVGAYDGRDAVRYAQSLPTAKVFAFEPIPESFALLSEQAASNAAVVPINAALSDVPGQAAMHVSNWVDASSLLPPATTGSTFDEYAASKSTVQVTVETIDLASQRLGVQRIDLLKMDAQGAELKILKGAQMMLAGRIGVIYTEVNFMDIYHGAATFEQIVSYLKQHGYYLHNIYNPMHNQTGRLAWADAIFLPVCRGA